MKYIILENSNLGKVTAIKPNENSWYFCGADIAQIIHDGYKKVVII